MATPTKKMKINNDTSAITNTRTNHRSSKVSVRFQLSSPKRAVTSLLCGISVNSIQAPRFVIESKVKTINWAQSLQKMLDDSGESQIINERIELVRLEINRTALRMQLKGEKITAQAVKEAYLADFGYDPKAEAAPKPTRPTFAECFISFYDAKSTNKRKPICDRTRESYWRYKRNLEKYLKSSKKKRLFADEMTHQWAEKYLDWLLEQFTNDYANNNVQLLKSVLQHAENTQLIDHNPLRGLKLYDKSEYNTAHLTMEEVNRIVTFDFGALPIHPDTAKSLREEADCFVFSCFSAQHHEDLLRRNMELFTHHIDGRIWLRAKRVKTGTLYTVPLHPIALKIIEKYGGIDKLPVKAAANRNEKLKQIATFCGLNILLTTKVGRKTFSNYAVNTQRMRFETVAAILGHKSTKFVKHYAQITEESIAAEYKF